MRKILELMKTPLIIPVIFAVLYCIVYIHTQLPKYDKEKIEAFDEIREEFYALNSYILTEYNGVDIDDMNIVFGRGYFRLFYNYDKVEEQLPNELVLVTKKLMDVHERDMIEVEVSDDWIAYGITGDNKYIFSRDGSFPYKSYGKERHDEYHCYVLKDDWYYFESLLR